MKLDFLKKIPQYLALGILLLPFSVGKELPMKPVNHNGQKSEKKADVGLDSDEPKILDLKHVFTDKLNREYLNYIVNNTQNQRELGIHPDGRNKMLLASQTNPTINSVFTNDQSLVEILRLFKPDLSQVQARQNIDQYPLLVGADIDYYLETVRKGSWGTTVMSVDREGKVHFDSISLASFLIKGEPTTSPANLQKLVTEEFFQAHQYDAVVAGLYNSGYLSQVAQIKSPEALVKEISIGNLRAFLELFPQQKYLTDRNLSKNSYNFYIGNQFFPGNASSTETVNAPYDKLTDFIKSELGIETSPTDFLDPEVIARINSAFRQKYLESYTSQGIPSSNVQIWNTVGMKRVNKAHEENSLDIPALLDLG